MTSARARTVVVGALVALLAATTPADPAPTTNSKLGSAQRAASSSNISPRNNQFSKPVSRTSLYHLKSAPLRTLVRVRAPGDRPAMPSSGRVVTPRAEVGDLLHPSGQLAIPAPEKNFDGIANTGDATPPDPSGEVGPNHFVQSTNQSGPGGADFAIFTKNGTMVVPPTRISKLWTGVGDLCETQGRGDAVIQYDQLAERWLLTQFAFNTAADGTTKVGPFYECIAVSETADPLGSYFQYSFKLSDTLFPDYPKFGVWPDAYYMSTHLFQPTSPQAGGVAIVAFDREAMLKGAVATMQSIVSEGTGYFGLLPADVDGSIPPPTGEPAILVSLNDARDQIQLFQYYVDWMNPSASGVVGPAVLQTGPWNGVLCGGSHDCIPQPGTPARLWPFAGGVVMYRAAYRNFGNREALVLNHTVNVGNDQAGIRWYEISGLQSSPGLVQGTTFSPDATSRFLGSIAMDRSGNIAVGYSGSSANQFPSVRYAGRLASDPVDTLPQGEAILTGQGSQTGSNRWGDYTHMSVDPSDDCTFWYTNEYYPTSSPTGWRTAIISFRFPSCNPTLPPPPDRLAPGIKNVRDRPDPFTPGHKVKITWTLTEAATVDIGVFKPNGQLVTMLVTRNPLGAGDWFTKWNGAGAGAGTYKFAIEARDASGNVARRGGKLHFVR